MSKPNRKNKLQRVLYQLILLLITAGASFAALFYLNLSPEPATDLETGDVSSQDILAPRPLTYESQVLTEQRRTTAVQDVSPRYTPSDTNIARQQLEHIRLALAYITSVRADQFASPEQKLADLAALQDIEISQESALGILELSDARWQTIQQEAIVVLEQVMRNPIRDNQVETYKESTINLVSLALPEDQAKIAAELAAAFITPNSFYSESLTEAAKQIANDNVPPVSVSYIPGETIVRRGEVVTPVEIEALQKFGLAEAEINWQDYASSGYLVVLAAFLSIVYFRRKPEIAHNSRALLIITLLFIIFLGGGRLMLPIHPLAPYLFPAAAFALIISGLVGAETALVLVVPLIILITHGHSNALELILYYGISSLFGVLFPRQEQRITGYLWVGFSVTASGAVLLTSFELLDSETTGLSLLSLFTVTVLNGIITAGFTVLMQSLLAPMLGQTTPLQLVELSRPDHPLLEYLLRNAPGTYQHSLQVANLAEQAAERIGANSLLTRVGALYHDIGKAKNAQFFIENQVYEHVDTHEDLDPKQTAGYIRNHVVAGMQLAKEHKLPKRIQDFITEHHGTFKTRYQWTQALKIVDGDASKLDKKDFTYAGPRPQSRETALVMLADGCEARFRAKQPKSEEEIREIAKETIGSCLADGQLDNTPLTLRELDIIADSFTATLKGLHHPRVEYPSMNEPTQPTLKPLIAPGTLDRQAEQTSREVKSDHEQEPEDVPDAEAETGSNQGERLQSSEEVDPDSLKVKSSKLKADKFLQGTQGSTETPAEEHLPYMEDVEEMDHRNERADSLDLEDSAISKDEVSSDNPND